MRILMCHKYFHRHGVSTGYMFNLRQVFRAHGHEVIDFAMDDPRNEPSQYSAFFAKSIDFNTKGSIYGEAKKVVHALYSVQARKQIELLIQHSQPDAVFLHTIYNHLTPSILLACKKHRLPVVQHLQDYFLICPNYKLLANGRICERCKRGRFHNAILQGCCNGSRKRSAAQALVTVVHRSLHLYEKNIDSFITPSEFVRVKHHELGFSGNMVHVPQAVTLDDRQPYYGNDGYIMYFGWLKPEKGVATLIKAMQHLPSVKLVVAGDGEDRTRLLRLKESMQLNNVSLVGALPYTDLLDSIRRASLVVVPSEWYEVYGMVIYEAFAMGKPVVASNIGGIPELVRNDVTGFVFEPGNHLELADRIAYVLQRPDLAAELGRNARELVEGELSAERNCASIISLLER